MVWAKTKPGLVDWHAFELQALLHAAAAVHQTTELVLDQYSLPIELLACNFVTTGTQKIGTAGVSPAPPRHLVGRI